MSSPQDKIDAIVNTPFPDRLSALETWLGMTGYFRNHIPNYAKIAAPLENRKTTLLKPAPTSGNPRKTFARRAKLTTPTPDEIVTFETICSYFRPLSFLYHHCPNRQLYVDLDACATGNGAMLYHLKDGGTGDQLTGPGRADIMQLIITVLCNIVDEVELAKCEWKPSEDIVEEVSKLNMSVKSDLQKYGEHRFLQHHAQRPRILLTMPVLAKHPDIALRVNPRAKDFSVD